MNVKMDINDIEKTRIENEGYIIKNQVIFSGIIGKEEKLGCIKDNSVEVIYGEFYLPDQVQEKITLAENLERLGIPYTEVLDKGEMEYLCGVRAAKKSFRHHMIINARRFLSLAERVDDFEFK